jgi:MFS family permease
MEGTVKGTQWQRILAGAIVGSATGISAVLLYTNGLFVAGLTHDFGLNRAQFGLGVTLVTMSLAAANPIVGWAVDRFGPRLPSLIGLLLLSAGFLSLALFVNSVTSYLLLQMLLALVGAASGPIAYTKFIGSTFDRHRGLALGMTMTGIGCSAAVLPPLIAFVIESRGWRAGYVALAVVPLLGVAITALLFPARAFPRSGTSPIPPTPRAPVTREWLRSRTFWTLAATFAAMSLSFGGLLPHFVPMLIDAGLDPLAAARVSGEIGLAVIASRLLVGFLLDRVFAPRVAIVICLIGASGGPILLWAGVPYASLTAIAIGLALGAELDLLGFLVARYFRLEEFGRIYGWQYGAFIFASGIGPLWVGAVRDATGSYAPALLASSAGLILTCVGFLLLPRYSRIDDGDRSRPAG